MKIRKYKFKETFPKTTEVIVAVVWSILTAIGFFTVTLLIAALCGK